MDELRILSADEVHTRNLGTRPATMDTDVRVNHSMTQGQALVETPKKKKPCFSMLSKGTCRFGDKCSFSHDKDFLSTVRKERKKAEQEAAAENEALKGTTAEG